MVEPIRPCDVKHEIPDFIIEAVNKLIQEKWNGHEAHIYQDEILDAIDFDLHGITRDEVFDKCWLDVEPLYRKRGWKVEYDKPAYCEDYKAYFVFKTKK